MRVEEFVKELDCSFFTGVPDSLLSPLADFLMDTYEKDPTHHIIAANEGNAVGLAAGYHLSTGKVPAIYMQNSGEGNAVNPITSLLNKKIYGIPAIFVVGWRGEPGIKDEPQHEFQGEITDSLMELLGVECFIVDKDTNVSELSDKIKDLKQKLSNGEQVCILVKKNALEYKKEKEYSNGYSLNREAVIKRILYQAKEDVIVATTGKTGREVFELREALDNTHCRDFLTVGSMGHASSIALGIAVQKPKKRVWCLDGDGAAIMHMGAMVVIGDIAPKNFIHVVFNNRSHESVGGLPTSAGKNTFSKVARELGYKEYFHVAGERSLDEVLLFLNKIKGPILIEIECAIGSRSDLGRPTIKPIDNKSVFMDFLSE